MITKYMNNNEDGRKFAESYLNALVLTSRRLINEEDNKKIGQKPYLKDVIEFANYLISDEFYSKANQTPQLFEDLKIYLPKLFSGSEYYVFFPKLKDFPEIEKYFSYKSEIDFTSFIKEKEKDEAKKFAKEIYKILLGKRSKHEMEIVPYFISSKGNNINDILILPMAKKNVGPIFGIIILTKDEGFEDKYLEIADELPSLLRSKMRWAFYNKELI